MLEPRTLIFFKPFRFKNNGIPKNKFFIVLHWEKGKGVLAGLPTSQDHIPSDFEDKYGCIEIPSANFNCFLFNTTDLVTDNGYKFEVKTILYGHLLDFYEESFFLQYPYPNIDYEIKGKLPVELYNKIVSCFKASKSVSMKYKRILSSI